MSSKIRRPIEAKAFLFDMDGTLLLSHAVVERIWRRWAMANGCDAEKILAVLHGRRLIDTMRDVCPPHLSPEIEAAKLDLQEREETDGIVAIAGAADFLASLPGDRWALVTSADRTLASIRLKAAGFPLPKLMITAEDVTVGKPDPQGYVEAARRLGVAPEETVVFEDAPAGIAAGRAAGAHVVVVTSILKPDELGASDWISDYTDLAVSQTADGGLRIG